MAFLAGERITAARLNRLQPTTYYAAASGTLAAGSTNADIPGVTIPITTTAANATYVAWLVADFDLTGATTSAGSARINVDGANASLLAVFAAEVATDRGTVAQTYRGTLATAGAHTIKAIATTPANMVVNTSTTLVVAIYEVA